MKKNQLVVIGVGVTVAALLATSAVIYANRSKTIAPPDIVQNTTPTHEDYIGLAKYVATDEFMKLPYDQKKPYIDKLGEKMMLDQDSFSSLTEDERRSAMRNLFRSQMNKHMEDYFSAKTPADRTKVLDGMIDRMEEIKKKNGGKMPFGPGGPVGGAVSPSNNAAPSGGATASTDQPKNAPQPVDGRPNGAPFQNATPEQQKMRVETMDPIRMAQMMEMFSAMSKRADERGIEMPGPHFGSK